MTAWPAPTAIASPTGSTPRASFGIDATVEVPGSKSETNRAYVLAALATGPSTITGALRSRDTDLMAAALTTLGADIALDGTTARVTPGPLRSGDVDCGLAGTVMRFVPPVATLASGTVVLDGDAHARVRPMSAITGALRDLGADVDGDALPLTVRGRGGLAGGEVTLDASGSSQFVSGLLLSAARFDAGVTVRHRGGKLPSLPHIDMTIAMLRDAGVAVTSDEPDTWRVAPGPVAPLNRVIEPDLSNAAPFLSAAAVTGGVVRVPNWPAHSLQPGAQIVDVLREMGADASLDDSVLTVRGPAELRGIDRDLSDIGELTPTIAALAALATTPSRLRGIGHLRGHETDRLAALSAEITRLGGDCVETSDGLIITPRDLHGGLWHCYADHRMATAGAIIGLRVAGVELDDVATTAKTLPDFARMWTELVAG